MQFRSNASDLAGPREENGVIHLSSAISIGKQPSVEQLKELRNCGFASVINLRCPGESGSLMEPTEEGREAAAAGLAYSHVPMPPDALSDEAIQLFRKELGRLCEPVFVHCAAGERAGALALAHLAIESGRELDQAFEGAPDALLGDESLLEKIRACLAVHESGELERLRTFRWICR